jgi:hypothetical protein
MPFGGTQIQMQQQVSPYVHSLTSACCNTFSQASRARNNIKQSGGGNRCHGLTTNTSVHMQQQMSKSNFKPEGPHLGSRSVQNEEHLEPTIQNTGILVNVSECFPKTIEQPNGIHNIVVNIKPNLFQTLFKHIGNQQTYAERLLLRH